MKQTSPVKPQPSCGQRSIAVPLGERQYHIHIGTSLLAAAGDLIRATLEPAPSRLAVISNRAVFQRYGRALVAGLEAASLDVVTHLMGDGERVKTLRTVERACRSLARHRLDRQSAIIALGGGVVGDVAGFVAACFLRGIAYIQIPTTLLAAIDSSVGGKTGVNLPEGKNLVGAFHQPRLVITDVDVLQSLPARELRAGLYEALKYGVIADADLFSSISQMAPAPPPFPDDQWVEIISRCCQIKANIVAEDEREAGHRQILNFGHTFGHAAEALTHYRRFRHGEAVGHGMILAARLAAELGLIHPPEAGRIAAGVQSVGPLPPIADIPIDAWVQIMRGDKKAQRDQLTFILPTRIGAVEIVTRVPTRLVEKTLRQALSA